MRLATYFALATAFISGVNTLVSKAVVSGMSDPVVFTTLKNGIVGVILIGALIVWNKWGEIKTLSRKQWYKLLSIGVIGGSIPFALFFTGLTQTSGMNAALIHKTLFIWVLLLAVPLLKEKVNSWQIFGIGAVFAANLFIGGFNGFSFNTGELMILGATLLWAVEIIIAKKVLKNVSSLVVASSRMVFGSLILLAFIFWKGSFGLVIGLGASQWIGVLITSLFLTGYVITWYTALKYAPATYVATLLVASTLVTNVLSAMFVTHTFSEEKLISSLLYIVGFICVIGFADHTAKETAKKLEISSVVE